MIARYIHKHEVEDYRAKGWKVALIGGHHGAGGYYVAWRDD